VEEENRRKKSLHQEEGKVMESPGGEMAPLSSMAGDPVALLTNPQMAHPANASLRAQATKELQRQRGNFYVQQVMKHIWAEKGSGRPLEPKVRAEMESAFGQDFGDVRVHTDAAADRLARELRATAFTTGTDIFFRQGQYAPHASQGQRLLAHELTHVVQQSGSAAIITSDSSLGTADDRYEREAHTMAERAVTNRGLSTPTRMNKRRLQCQPEGTEETTIFETIETIFKIIAVPVYVILEAEAERLVQQPDFLARQCQRWIDEIGPILSDMKIWDPLFDPVHDVYWGFAWLAYELRRTEGTTTPEQRDRYRELVAQWVQIKEEMDRRMEEMEDENRRRIRQELAEARARMEQIRERLVLLYRKVYLAGGDDTTEFVTSETGRRTITLRELSGHVVSILNAINAADAEMTGRSISPLVTVLTRVHSFVNLFLGWSFTSELASEIQEDFAALQNALSLATTGLSLTRASPFLAFLSHIPLLLGEIAQGWDILERALREQNTEWWEVFGKLERPQVEPGGRAMWNYMLAVFRASSPEELPAPDEDVVDYFNDHREMFSRVATDLMETRGVPTKSWFLFWRRVDPSRLNSWVFYNRRWIWRLLYGSRRMPEEG
jgi:hypothetical protein